MRRPRCRGTSLGVLAPLVLAVTLLTVPAHADTSLGDVRIATAAYHSVARANRAGYLDNPLPCFDSPSGGMGEHLIDGDAIDRTVDALHPEALVYEVRAGSWKLVAVEYLALRLAGSAAPSLFGQDFHPITVGGTDLWALHAWVWREHPTDPFADFNPNVAPCP